MTEPNIVIQSKDGNKKQKILSKKESKSKSPPQKQTKASSEVAWRSSAVQQVSSQDPVFSWPKVWPFLLAIVGAIAVGAILGFSILNLFADSPAQSERKSKALQSQQRGFSAFLLQVGEASKEDPPYQKRRKLRLRGLSVVMTDQPYRLLLGVAIDAKQAAKLVKLYQSQGIDVKAKQWNFQGRENQVPPELKPMVKIGHPLFQRLSRFTVSQLQNESQSNHDFQPERKQYHQMLAAYRQVRQKLKPKEKKQAIRMLQAMEQAVESGVTWSRHPSDPLLQQMQEGLVRYIMAYKQLIEGNR